ncbi:MAG: dienelactone hydrolase family protein [Alphaproteobacteria bacterium]|nr:dienelactone hydrolase family protein [Alphaproteobacteria bacterium]
MTGSMITIKAHDGGSFGAYLAKPAAGKGPGVVVIQEIFGVNANVRAIADGLAAEGFFALAPDLFWRIEPGIDITDKTEAEWKKAFELFGKFDIAAGVKDIQATLTALRAQPGCTGKAGAVGYCLGGLLAYLTAARTDSNASVGFYGVNIKNFLGEQGAIKAPLLLHVAEKDEFVPPPAQAEVAAGLVANPHVTILTYMGQDHAFARMGGKHFHAGSALAANAASLAFFKKHLA